jgi:ribosomal protein L7/L12
MRDCPFCDEALPAGATECPHCGAFVGAEPAPPQADVRQLAAQLRVLLAEGRKLEAIKLYREATGVGLQEAKEAVDSLAAGGAWATGGEFAESAASPTTEPLKIDESLELELLALLERRTLLAAVKLCMQRTGASLAEAKQAVNELATRHGLQPASGCGGVLGVLIIVAVVGAIVALAIFLGLGS